MLRSTFLTLGAAAAATAADGGAGNLNATIADELSRLPSPHGIALSVSNAGRELFSLRVRAHNVYLAGSAFKIFVLTEFLRMVERGEASLDEMLPLDESVFVPGSQAFFPAGNKVTLRGAVPAQVAAHMMIYYSDNTATDMMLKRVGPHNVRSLLSANGFSTIKIPDSTKRYLSYINGFPASLDPPWTLLAQGKDVPGIVQGPARDTLNDVETTCGSLDDYISFYERVDRGEFFREPSTLDRWRAFSISSLNGRIIPLGSIGYTKGGSVDGNGATSALFAAGRMYTGVSHIVSFALASNWRSKTKLSDIEPTFVEVCSKILTAASTL
jgi:beta-lactamase class A